MRSDPVVLLILDGWGEGPDDAGNAIRRAGLRHVPAAWDEGVSATLDASGRAVGLPAGVMGNSEVGHLTIGAGRVVDQDLVRIDEACRAGEIAERPVARELFAAAKHASGRLHLLALCSDAGVHSHLDHLRAVALGAAAAGVSRILLHPFTDGRDTPPDSGLRYVTELERFAEGLPGCAVASVGGRYFAMDRDRRWDRVERAWQALACGAPMREDAASAVVAEAYRRGVTDEFVEPVLVLRDGVIGDGDSVAFLNFRPDRARQLTRAFTDPTFREFPLEQPRLASFATMTQYSKDFALPVFFEPHDVTEVLGEVFARARWPQLRLAETEKYAHVTYFLNGGREATFPGEERILVPSPKVATYDRQPAMSARELAAQAASWIGRGGRRLLVVNFANADMVGHTGDLAATIEACRVADECVGQVVEAVGRAGGVLVMTADHGNAEVMRSPAGAPHTAHTTNRVPFVLLDRRHPRRAALGPVGGLSDVAPTLLAAAGIEAPAAMTGRSLA